MPATFSPEATKLASTLASATDEDAKSWLTGKRKKKRKKKLGQFLTLKEEEECEKRVSSIIPEHQLVRAVYDDLSLENARRKRDELVELRRAQKTAQQQRGRSRASSPSHQPNYEFTLLQLKLDRAANRPAWNNTTDVRYPRLDPRQLSRSPDHRTASSTSRRAQSPLAASASASSSPTALTAFPVSPSSDRPGVLKKYMPSRRSLDPIRHVKREQGNVIKVLTAMRADADGVADRLRVPDERHGAVLASEYTKIARFMANAAISRVEKVALIEVDISVPQTMQEQMATMTEEMLEAAIQVKQLRDVASIVFVWDIMDEIERLLAEAPPATREVAAVVHAVQQLEDAERMHAEEIREEFPYHTSSVQHAIDNVDDPLPLPSVIWGKDVGGALSAMATAGRQLNALAEDTLEVVRQEAEAVGARMRRERAQRAQLQRDVLDPGHALLAEILNALETMPPTSGVQGADGLVATYDRARAVLAVVERVWAVEVDLSSPTHVVEVLETLVEYSAVFLDAAQRSYRLVVGVRKCAGEVVAVQDTLGAEDTPQQILNVPAIVEITKFLDAQIGRMQGSVWTFGGGREQLVYPKAFEAHVNSAVDEELAAFSAELDDLDALVAVGDVPTDAGAGAGAGAGASGEGDSTAVVAAVGRSNDNAGDGDGEGGEDVVGVIITDEQVLTEPQWMRVKVDEMTRSMQELRKACGETREVVDRELPLIKERKAREMSERAAMKEVVGTAAGMVAHFETVLAKSHPQLKRVPELAEKMAAARSVVAETTAALESEVDLTGEEETAAALAGLRARSEAALALAKELALRLEIHAADLEARVRRETLGRQRLNRDLMPGIRAALAALDQTLGAAHPQLRSVDTVRSNHAEFKDRFLALQHDLRTCVDVTSQAKLDGALKSLDARCEDLASEGQFVVALVADEEAALVKRLQAFEELRTALEEPLIWKGVGHYEAAVVLYNEAPAQLRGLGGAAASAIADGKGQVDAIVAAWKVTPDLTATTKAETDATLGAFRNLGEVFCAAMGALEALIRQLVQDMQERLDAERALRQELHAESLEVAHAQVAAIGDALRMHPHMQEEGHHVATALKALAAMAVDTEGHMQSITVDVTSDEAMAKDMAKLRAHAEELDATRRQAEEALSLERARMLARRKIVVDGLAEVNDDMLMPLVTEKQRLHAQIADAPPKFGTIPKVAELKDEVDGIVARAKSMVDALSAKVEGSEGADALLFADDDAGLAALAQLRQDLGPMQIRCREVAAQIASEMTGLLARQAEEAKRRADLRESRLGPAELVLAEVRQSMELAGGRMNGDDELNTAVASAAASVAKCHHLLETRLDCMTEDAFEDGFQLSLIHI